MKARININPPPEDVRCDCCGRHISELTPFGKAGDPLIGDFDGELLVKKFRPSGPYDEQAEKAWNRVEKLMEKEGRAGEDPLDMMIKINGKEEKFNMGSIVETTTIKKKIIILYRRRLCQLNI